MADDYWIEIENLRTLKPGDRENWARTDIRWLQRIEGGLESAITQVVQGRGTACLTESVASMRAALDEIEAKYGAIHASGVIRAPSGR